MITWQPNLPDFRTRSVLASIADGSQDSYIRSWAAAAKATNHRIYVRPMHEMNGDWYPWGAVQAGTTRFQNGSGVYPYTNTPQMYVAAFQHLVSLFRQAGADNVEFVWCIAASASLGNVTSYYPGNSYVSWTSFDAYNRSASSPKSFYSIARPAYAAITAITTKPILVAETATVEYSGAAADPTSKAQWIIDAYLQTIPQSFPQIRAIDWFDSPGKNYSYQIDTSPATEQAIRQVFASPVYQATAP